MKVRRPSAPQLSRKILLKELASQHIRNIAAVVQRGSRSHTFGAATTFYLVDNGFSIAVIHNSYVIKTYVCSSLCDPTVLMAAWLLGCCLAPWWLPGWLGSP